MGTINYINDFQHFPHSLENKESGKLRIKVCGMTQMDQILQLNEWGVDFAGFIFYPKSPRYALNQLAPGEIKSISGNINKAGVFVNAPQEELLKTVEECGLDLVQLHGDETPRYCAEIADYIPVIKAFRLSEDDQVDWKIKDYIDVVDMILFDTQGQGYGGTGKKFNWELLKGLNIHKPYFLSGGISPEDVENLKAFQQDPVAKDLYAIDINSCFEISPGMKDMNKVKTFIELLND